jgi:tRNA(adenine34) deaminase
MDNQYMEAALSQALLAEQAGEVPIGAVITGPNGIIARAYNQTITQQDATAHAEILCIKEASKALKNHRLSECEIYVTLEPCLMCIGAICQSRIKKVFFGAYDKRSGFISKELSTKALNLNWHPEFEGGILEEPCQKLLQGFFQARR